jgi:hypothetical protein
MDFLTMRGEDAAAEPDWGLAAQPEPDYEIDQLVI